MSESFTEHAGEIDEDAQQPLPPEEVGEFTPFDGQDLTSQPVAPEAEPDIPADD